MIKLFNANDRDFTSNGIVAIHPKKLKETKKISLNGWFIEVELDLKQKDLIEQDMLAVVQTKSKLAPQAFRITDIEYTQKNMTFVAHHVLFDAHKYYLVDVRPTRITAGGALGYVQARTDKTNPFTFSSDVNNYETAYFLDRSLMYAMEEIENRWGGQYQADNWNVRLSKTIGLDKGEVIAYGKNLQEIKIFEDWSSVITRIYPIGYDGLRLPEDFIDADIQYETPYTQRIDFETKFEDDEQTSVNMIPELRLNAQNFLDDSKHPKVSYEVTSDINQTLEVGDTVHVKHPLVMLEAQVQEYEYNILTNRVVKIVFGNYSRDVKKRFDKIKEDIKEVELKTSIFEKVIGDQSDLINNMSKFGHVYIDDNQILILDKLPKETANNVWRWNLGGLGFSSTGMEGPFTQAWTMDGVFNTDFISANSIVANQLSSDVGASLDLTGNGAVNILIASKDKYENGEISGANYSFDGEKATFYGGGLTIKDYTGRDVFDVGMFGDVSMVGNLTSGSPTRNLRLNNGSLVKTIPDGTFPIMTFTESGGTSLRSAPESISPWQPIYVGMGRDADFVDSNRSLKISRFGTNLTGIDGVSIAAKNGTVRFESSTAQIIMDNGSIRPITAAGAVKLGHQSWRWSELFLLTQPNVSSDRRQKSMIENIPQELIDRLVRITPKQFVQGGKVHFGYIAQDVEREIYKYCVVEYGYENANLAMERYAILHKSESHLSLLYGEIAVLKDAYYMDKIDSLEKRLEALEKGE